jgi:diguanylate cyclase (GGDEF)-like protein/PAS domain S-box-containing protein
MAEEVDAALGHGYGDHSRSVLDAVAVGYLVSQGRRIVEVNPFLCRMLGFAREELIGLELPWPFTPPEGIEISHAMGVRMSNEALLKGSGHSDPVELPLMRKDGTRFMGEVIIAPLRDERGSPLRDGDGDVLAWVSTVRDVSKRHDYEVELERLARQDPLTGLANRRLFDERLEQEMADAIRHDRSLAVAILDLDGFKAVNDLHGHPTGDRVLQEAATRLQRALRRGDLLARVGGEEFAWILPEVHSHGAWAAAERARRAIGETPFEGIGDLTISIGVALRGQLTDGPALYEHADESLYRAKREGRDRCVMWRQG